MRCNGVVVTRHRSLPSRSIKKRNSDKSTVDTSLELREQNVEAVREGRQSTVRWIGEWWEDNAVATATAGDRWTGGRPTAGPGERQRGNAWVPWGDGRRGWRWQGCIYLPYSQYTKVPRSTRYAADSSRWQSTLLGSSRENNKRGERNKKKYREAERVKRGREWHRERETEVKERRKFATRVRRSFSMGYGEKE